MNALDVLCAQLTRDLFVIAKFLFLVGLLHTQGAQAWITHFYPQITPCLYLVRAHQMVLPLTCNGIHLITALLLIYRPRKDERLSLFSWLAYSGRFNHISGHPSAVGRAQRMGKFYHCATNKPLRHVKRRNPRNPRNDVPLSGLKNITFRPLFADKTAVLGTILTEQNFRPKPLNNEDV